MANLKYKKFKSGLEFQSFNLFRFEISKGNEVVFAIKGTELSVLLAGYSDIDFDQESDEILANIPENTNAYFMWDGQEFYPCKRNEILSKNA